MVVVVVLITIAVPSYRQLIVSQGIKTASFDLYSALEYARSEAIKRPSATVVLCAGNSTANNGAWGTGWRVVGAGRSLSMKRRQGRRAQAGFLMMEVLITLFILIFGTLGLAALQAR